MVSYGSLRLRLVFLASGVLLLAVVATWFGLSNIFEQHVEHRVQAELTNHLNQLIVSLDKPGTGQYRLAKPLSDPRFRKPFSGIYWQISSDGRVLLKSRSLWDFTLNGDIGARDIIGLQEYKIEGPGKTQLFSVVQNVSLDAGDGEKKYLMIVSLDHSEITEAVKNFSSDLLLVLLALVIVFILALFIQVSIGLLPLKQMKKELIELQQGKRQKLMGNYPVEIAPVVSEINDFITTYEMSAKRGRQRASDLAHGFKTPLAILLAEARRMENQGATETAVVLRQQITSMSHHVERELARAKIQMLPLHQSNNTNINNNMAKIITTLKCAPRKTQVDWRLKIPEDLFVQMEEGDFMEVCGNLLENAHKWTARQVNVSACSNAEGAIVLEIEDDGPGVAKDQFETMMQRGKRLDEAVQGSGLGLAIANDIMAAYRYQLEPYRNARGGLGMRLVMSKGISRQNFAES